jgi:hypothetical protein
MYTNTRSLHSLAPESVYLENSSLVSRDGTLRLNSPRYPSQLQLGAQIIDWGTATTSSGLGTTGTTTSFLRG